MSDSVDTIAEQLTDPDHGRRNIRDLAARLRWGVDDETRAASVAALKKIIDDPATKVRSRISAIKALADLNKQDQADIHHLEGQKVNLTATINKSPDEEAADLLAEMRRGELKPKAN